TNGKKEEATMITKKGWRQLIVGRYELETHVKQRKEWAWVQRKARKQREAEEKRAIREAIEAEKRMLAERMKAEEERVRAEEREREKERERAEAVADGDTVMAEAVTT